MTGFGLPTNFRFGSRIGFPQGGAAAPFSPADVSGLYQWLKADDIVGLNDADPVTTWQDSHTTNRDATQSDVNLKPTYRTNVVNGKAVVRFDGVNDFLELGDYSALTEGEAFIVVKIDTDPPGAQAQTGLWVMGSDTLDAHFPFIDNNIYDHFGTTARKTVGDPTPALTSWRVYNVYSASNDWQCYLDGVSLYSTGTNTVGFPSSARLGADDGGGFCLDGDVAEFILYSNKLSAGDRTSVFDYLTSEYGL